MRRRTFLSLIGSALVYAAGSGVTGRVGADESAGSLGEQGDARERADRSGGRLGRLAAAFRPSGRVPHAGSLPSRRAPGVGPPAREDSGRQSRQGTAAHLAAFRSRSVRLDRRRYRPARLEQARLSVRPRVRPCNVQHLEPEGNSAEPPTAAWLEEALVEAFSIRGLGLSPTVGRSTRRFRTTRRSRARSGNTGTIW